MCTGAASVLNHKRLSLALGVWACRTHPHEMEMLETNGALCLTEALQDSEYGYFKSDILSAWAGPQHWKVKTSVKGAYKTNIILISCVCTLTVLLWLYNVCMYV